MKKEKRYNFLRLPYSYSKEQKSNLIGNYFNRSVIFLKHESYLKSTYERIRRVSGLSELFELIINPHRTLA